MRIVIYEFDFIEESTLHYIHLHCCSYDSVFLISSLGANALPNGLDVTFEVTELKRLTGSYNTMVGNNEGSMVRIIIHRNYCTLHPNQM